MTLYEKIISLYPELRVEDFSPFSGVIQLQNDGHGDYIKVWEHPTLPKPTEEQLA